MDIAQASVAFGGHDAKGDQCQRVVVHYLERQFQRCAKAVLWLDDVVGGDHGDDGILVELADDGRAEAHGIGGVAALGLAQQILPRKIGQVVKDSLRVLVRVQTKMRSGGMSVRSRSKLS